MIMQKILLKRIEMNNIDNECKNCPDRRVGCHNVKTCSFWAEHEKKKEKLYKVRKEISEQTSMSIEKAYFKRKMRRHDHDTRR